MPIANRTRLNGGKLKLFEQTCLGLNKYFNKSDIPLLRYLFPFQEQDKSTYSTANTLHTTKQLNKLNVAMMYK